MKRLVYLLMFSLPCFAHAAQSTLSYENNLGVRQKFQIDVEEEKVYLNGVLLSPFETIAKRELIAQTLRVSSELSQTPQMCAAGTFHHEVTLRPQEKKIESGCLEGQRFGALVFAYRGILSSK